MPLHDYIKRIYEEVNDPAYIIRFLNYLVNTRYKRVSFSANGITVEPLITGVLEDIKTKKRFYTIADFYTYATGTKVRNTDIGLLSKVFVTQEYTVMRIICNIKEQEILNFFDQKYRAFLMYRDVRKRIKFYALKDTNEPVRLEWNNNKFMLYHNSLTCDNEKETFRLLEAYENGFINGLYYCTDDSRHLITDS